MRISPDGPVSKFIVAAAAACLAVGAGATFASASAIGTPRPRLTGGARGATAAPGDSGLIAYFSGRWACRGAFANGTPVASEESFAAAPGGAWLTFHHADRPPNGYEAWGAWSMTPVSGTLVAILQDKSGGVRLFSAPWPDRQSVVLRRMYLGADTNGLRPEIPAERFTYQRRTGRRYTVTYERSIDGARWQLGDSLTCSRVPGR